MAELSYSNIRLLSGMDASDECPLTPNVKSEPESQGTILMNSSPDKSSPSEARLVVGEIVIPESGNLFIERFSHNGSNFEVSGEYAGMNQELVLCQDSEEMLKDLQGTLISAALGEHQNSSCSIQNQHVMDSQTSVPHHPNNIDNEGSPEYTYTNLTTCTPVQPIAYNDQTSLVGSQTPVHQQNNSVDAIGSSQNTHTVRLTTNNETILPSVKSDITKIDSLSPANLNSSTPMRHRPVRNKLLTSQLLSPDEIVREVIEQAERRRPPQIPEGGDLLFQKQLTKRLANKVVKEELLARTPSAPIPVSSPKPCTDVEALRLLSILQDSDGHEKEKDAPEKESKSKRSRAPPKPPIDRELERELALKQLMEVSRKRVRKQESNNNEDKEKEKEKAKRMKPELKRLLQDEGAINMLYELENADKPPPPGKRPSKKTLHKKAQEVEQALLGSPGRRKPRRKSSKAQASIIVRRHSSSSSYSSRGSSPARRSSIEENGESPKEDTTFATPTSTASGTQSHLTTPQKSSTPGQLPDSNGFKEKLQNEFSSKFKSIMVKKAILSVKREQKGIEPLIHPVAKSPQIPTVNPSSKSSLSTSPKDSVWQMLQDDWQLEDDHGPASPESAQAPSTPPSAPSAVPTSSSVTPTTSAPSSTPSITVPAPKVSIPSKPLPAKIPDPCPIKTEIAPLPAADPQVENYPDINDVPFTHRLGNFEYKELLIRQIGPLIHIKIAPISTFLPQAFNVRVLRELTRAMDEVGAGWSGCKALLLTSSSKVFSSGVDLPCLVSDDPLNRTTVARELAQAVKEFVFKLGMLQKPVIAGVEGPSIGLGMAMLAFCDLVYATSSATFFLPHHLLGYSPEGAITLSLPIVLGFRRMVSLIMTGERLGSNQAKDCGFVTEILPDEDFTKKVVHRSYDLAIHSPEIMEMIKTQYMSEIRAKLSSTLTVETNRLQLQWPTLNCQMRIKEHGERLLIE